MADVDTIARSGAAKRELRETEKAFADLRSALVEKLIATPAEAAQTRETCYFAINALDGVKTALQRVVEGAIIEEAVEELLRQKKPEVETFAPIRGAGFR